MRRAGARRGRDEAETNRALRPSAAERIRLQTAKSQVAELAESDLFVAGVVAYWAEGAKNKPWRTGPG